MALLRTSVGFGRLVHSEATMPSRVAYMTSVPMQEHCRSAPEEFGAPGWYVWYPRLPSFESVSGWFNGVSCWVFVSQDESLLDDITTQSPYMWPSIQDMLASQSSYAVDLLTDWPKRQSDIDEYGVPT